MIKEALEYLNSNFTASASVGGRKFIRNEYVKVTEPLPSVLKIATLSGMIDLAKNFEVDADKINLFFHIDGCMTVHLCGPRNADNQREIFASAHSPYEKYTVSKYFQVDDFIIYIKSKFVQDANTDLLLSIASNIDVSDSASLKDDGISQEINMKSGVHLVETRQIPSIIELRPYSTFEQIEQPACEYVFRIKKDGSSAKIGLFECDNANWETKAIQDIYEYLTKNGSLKVIR